MIVIIGNNIINTICTYADINNSKYCNIYFSDIITGDFQQYNLTSFFHDNNLIGTYIIIVIIYVFYTTRGPGSGHTSRPVLPTHCMNNLLRSTPRM